MLVENKRNKKRREKTPANNKPLKTELSYLDSNQDKQNQNLLCYHYTIGQSSCASFRKSAAKIEVFLYLCKVFSFFIQL